MQFIEDGIRYNRIGDCKAAVVGFGIDMDKREVVIPTMTKNGYRVIWVSANAFEKNQTIESIVLPDTISLIGEKAFYKCLNLKHVRIEHQHDWDLLEQDQPVDIGKKAFSGCKNLFDFYSYKNIQLSGALAFHNCVLLPKIYGCICGNLPEKSFLNCMSLDEFHFYDKTMQIGKGCFDDCFSLNKFYILEDLDLGDEFLKKYKECEFYCHGNSKYLNLAYHGYNIKKILPRV